VDRSLGAQASLPAVSQQSSRSAVSSLRDRAGRDACALKLENKLQAELKLATVLRGRLINRLEIGKWSDQLAVGIRLDGHVVELNDAACH
jgi:hypothetical protein